MSSLDLKGVNETVYSDNLSLSGSIGDEGAQHGGRVMSERVQNLASSIYEEFQRLITVYGEDVVKELMPLVVGVLESLDQAYLDKNELEVEVDLVKEDNEQLMTQYEKEKLQRKQTEQRYMEIEDVHDEDKKEIQAKNESLVSIVRMLELKNKNATDHISRLEERDFESKSEYNKLHDRYTELFRTHCEYMERTKFLLGGSDRLNDSGHHSISAAGSHSNTHRQANYSNQSNFDSLHSDDMQPPVSSADTSLTDQSVPIPAPVKPGGTEGVGIGRSLDNELATTKSFDKRSPASEMKTIIGSRHMVFSSSSSSSTGAQTSSSVFNPPSSSTAVPIANAFNPLAARGMVPIDQLEDSYDSLIQTEDETVPGQLTLTDGDNGTNDKLRTANSTSSQDSTSQSPAPVRLKTGGGVGGGGVGNKQQRTGYELTFQDEDDLTGVGKEVESLIAENTELLSTKNALNIVKNDLIAKVDELSSEQVILKEEISSLKSVKRKMEGQVDELESQVKMLREDNEKLKKSSEDEDGIPLAQKKKFTRIEMSRVLLERNQYKERLMELQEAVRWTEMIRASREHPELTQGHGGAKKQSSVWNL